MLLRVVNPNTTATMTSLVDRAARAAVAPGTVVETVHPTTGPVSIECHVDEALAVPGLLEQIALGEAAGAAAHVVACFGDPGLDAARELAAAPVVGIAEGAYRIASTLGRRFGVVTTLARTSGRAHELAVRHGVAPLLTEVRACEVPVLDLHDPASGARERVLAECRAVLDGGADAVVLGCAGMADLAAPLSAELGAPVVDGVGAAVVLAEGLGRLGLRTGSRGEFAPPPPKRVVGLLEGFSRPAPGDAA